ncbi:MAG: hypothetical protein M3436_02200 [Pseudomonadota bacterium]|nr:hypothetical protein [Pseudomonadota bacterium]
MRAFRHRRLCWGVTGVLLLAGLGAHMQLLFACEVMDGAPKLVCCCDTEAPADGCESGGGCVTHAAAAAQGCCEITLAPAADLTPMTSTSQGQLLTLIAAAQVPPISPPPAGISPHPHAGIAGLPRAYTPFWLPGVQTYLFTNRFRI